MDEGIEAFEGLVGKTAELFSAMVGYEIEDLKQELRIKVMKVRRVYDPLRTPGTEKAFVYSCVANYVKDLKRNAARASKVRVEFIEDHRNNTVQPDSFDLQYLNLSREEVFAEIDDRFTFPATLTEDERIVVVMLMSGYEFQSEIARVLGIPPHRVSTIVACAREKLEDWRPSAVPEPLPLAPLPQLMAA